MSGGARSNGVSAGAQAQIEDLTTQVLLIHVAFGNFYLSLFFGHFRLSWMAVKPRHLLRKASLATCNSQWVKKGKKSLSPKICQALQIARQLSCCPLCFRKIQKELTPSPPRSSRWSSRWKDWRRKEIFTLVSLKGSKYSQASFIIQTNRHLWYYYFPGKLRDVEVMCQENEAEGGEIIRKVNDPSFSAIDCISYFYRFWTFFIRQKMALLFLKRRTALHLRRERKNISVPSTWMLLGLSYRKCVSMVIGLCLAESSI